MSPPLMVLPDHVLARPAASKKRGHADIPGTGPVGETCGSCKHLFRNEMQSTYLKCELRRGTWTGSYGTDVRAKDAACRRWEAKA